MTMPKLQVIGGGKMGEALVAGLLAGGWASTGELRVVERLADRAAELRGRFPGLDVGDEPGVAQGHVVAVKPGDVEAACRALAAADAAAPTAEVGGAASLGDVGSAGRGGAASLGDAGSARAGGAASLGDVAAAAPSGEVGGAASLGDVGAAAPSGEVGGAASLGDVGAAAPSGEVGGAASLGDAGSARAGGAASLGDVGSAGAGGGGGGSGAPAPVLSIAAGVTLARLEGALAPGTPVVRAMPNTPALVGAGAAAVAAGSAASDSDVAWASSVLGAVGTVVVVSESLLDAVTGLSGSGPAYLFLVVEALVEGGVLAGLPRDVASSLAVQTLVGSGQLLASSSSGPEALRAAVTSPGGTTAAGLRALERGGVRAAFLDAVMAAAERSRELGATS
jgi:pyrroline-5-carboxylate reductase